MKAHVRLKVGGDFACFTRPGFPVERVTYPVMTPSAARGLLEAIFWKPEFRWEIREIWVLKPIKEVTIVRNELKSRQGDRPIFIEDQDTSGRLKHRQQRVSLILKEVEYLIAADIRLLAHATQNLRSYLEQFERRVVRGGCHHTPYLGTKEFAAWFENPDGLEVPCREEDRDLGMILFDIAFRINPAKKLKFWRHGPEYGKEGKGVETGHYEAIFFPARLDKGVLMVPPEKYLELYEREGVNVKRTG